MLIKLTGGVYSQVEPTKLGTYDCDDSWVAKVPATVPALVAAKLDSNRISQQFAK